MGARVKRKEGEEEEEEGDPKWDGSLLLLYNLACTIETPNILGHLNYRDALPVVAGLTHGCPCSETDDAARLEAKCFAYPHIMLARIVDTWVCETRRNRKLATVFNFR